MAKTTSPEGASAGGGTQGSGGVEQQETIIRDPVPDAVSRGEGDAGLYDSDFNYLASQPQVTSQPGEDGSTTDDDQVEDGSGRTGSAAGGKEESPATSPSYPVPPVARKKDGESADGEVPSDAGGAATSPEELTKAEKRYNDLKSFHDTEVVNYKKQIEQLQTEVKTYQDLKTYKEELEQDPLAFLTRYYPELSSKVDTRRLIVDKLKKEFGEFTFDPTEAYIEGTTSYKVRMREQEILDELQRERVQRLNTERAEQDRREGLLNASKAKVMEKYGLSEEQFNQVVVEGSKKVTADWEAIAKLIYFDWHMQNAVDEALAAGKRLPRKKKQPGTTDVGGTAEPPEVSAGFKELSNVFGDM